MFEIYDPIGGLDPEIVQNLMNTLFGRLSAVVESHGGSVDKIIGDAIGFIRGAQSRR